MAAPKNTRLKVLMDHKLSMPDGQLLELKQGATLSGHVADWAQKASDPDLYEPAGAQAKGDTASTQALRTQITQLEQEQATMVEAGLQLVHERDEALAEVAALRAELDARPPAGPVDGETATPEKPAARRGSVQ